MNRIELRSGRTLSTVGYAELPRRADPGLPSAVNGALALSPLERAHILREALATGSTSALLTYERDVVTFREACVAGDIGLDSFEIVTTDGAALERCDSTRRAAKSAIERSIARKTGMLSGRRPDVFGILDLKREVHTPDVLAGAADALAKAIATGDIGSAALICFDELDYAAKVVRSVALPIEMVIGRFNALDQMAKIGLLPACDEQVIAFYAVGIYAWVAGVPFVRFPNTWRLRNLTQNFTGISAGQAHLRWLLNQNGVSGAFAGCSKPEQAAQNAASVGLDGVLSPPQGVESLLAEFVTAITGSKEGWTGLLDDERWEYRLAAKTILGQA